MEPEPLVWQGLLDPPWLSELWSACDFQLHPAPARYTSFDRRTEFAPVPDAFAYIAPAICEAAAATLGTPPVTSLQATILRYAPGVGHDWHADGAAQYEMSARRSVSFSLLLNEPGHDFAGGEFETEFGLVPLGAGDAVAFTAATRHRVRPVTAGRRLVLVCFGSSTNVGA